MKWLSKINNTSKENVLLRNNNDITSYYPEITVKRTVDFGSYSKFWFEIEEPHFFRRRHANRVKENERGSNIICGAKLDIRMGLSLWAIGITATKDAKTLMIRLASNAVEGFSD